MSKVAGSALVGVFAAAGAAVLFGVNATVSKVALGSGLSSLDLVQLRALGSATVLMTFLLLTRPSTLRAGPKELGFLAVVGVLGIGLVQWFYFVAISRLPVGIALLLEYLAPVLVVLWVRFVRRDAVRRRMWGALVLSVLGLVVVGRVWEGLTLDGLGLLAGLGAAASLATYYLSSERGMGTRDPLSLAAWTFTAAALFWSALRPPWSVDWSIVGKSVELPASAPAAAAPLWLLVVWVIVLGTVVPYSLILLALRSLGSARTGLLGMGEPVMAGLFAWLVLGEVLSGIQLVGAGLILSGILLAETARQRSGSRAERPLVPPSGGPPDP
ncbi:MAG: DMT family transporter [Actinomycetota bacterium]|nr:DMT family transporter [Actinomycetota bacterium]